jgi:hypothetical protein
MTTNGHNGLAGPNGILQHDADKGRVAVHSFDPAASPAEKGAAAGKARDQLKSVKEQESVAEQRLFDVRNFTLYGLTSLHRRTTD